MKCHHLHKPPKHTLSVRCSAQRPSPGNTPWTAHNQTRRDQLQQLALGVLGLQLGSLCNRVPAEASIANDAARGVVAFWKSRQSQNGGIKLLAPLRVAQRRLEEASTMLDNAAVSTQIDAAVGVDEAAVAEVLQRVRASSLNCYAFDAFDYDTIETKASLITQKFEISDPCTFRIVLKTVTTLEPAAVKLEAASKMDDLVLSYQRLDSALEMAREGDAAALPKAQQEIKTTMHVAADIESLVIKVLGV